MPPVHRHRASTSLRQSNKKHKSTKTSKRSVHKNAGGKVGATKVSGTGEVTSHAKAARVLLSKQKRVQSKAKLLERKRLQGRVKFFLKNDPSNTNSWWTRPTNTSVVPRVVGLISLSQVEDVVENRVRAFLLEAADNYTQDGSMMMKPSLPSDGAPSYTAQYKKMKREGHVTYLTNSSAFRSHYYNPTNDTLSDDMKLRKIEDASVFAALDLCRVCDLVLFLVHHDLDDLNPYDCHGPGGINDDDLDMDDDNDDHMNDTNTREVDAVPLGHSCKSSTSTYKMKHSQDFDHLISRRGDRILSAIKAQGLPTPLTVLVNEGNHSLNDLYSKATNTMDDTMSIFSTKSTKSLNRSGIKRQQGIKKYMTRFVTTEFGEDLGKLAELDLPLSSIVQSDCFIDQQCNGNFKANSFTRDLLIRTICTMRCSTPKWVMDMPRAYILSHGPSLKHYQSASIGRCEANNDAGGGFQYDHEHHELKITGYIRGQTPWNVNSLVHIPNLGTFGVKCIENSEGNMMNATITHRRQTRDNFNDPMVDTGEAFTDICKFCDPLKRESLNMFACPDALEGEQNLVGFDNHYVPSDTDPFQPGVARPAGWSDYQASWIDALDASDDQDGGKVDHGELAFDLNKKNVGSRTAIDDEFAIHDYDMTPRDHEKANLVNQRKSEQKAENDFPDEVEIQRDQNARDRFARYRSIKSFQKTFWDPKENLPETYASIYHFSSFKNTENDVMAEMKCIAKTASDNFSRKTESTTRTSFSPTDEQMSDEDSSGNDEVLKNIIPSGSFVTITIEGIFPSHYARISELGLITAVSLLPHENKISVIQMGLNQSSQCDPVTSTDSIPIKSKDNLIFRCGWRTWQGRPIFSQHNLNSDKHKYERFMPINGAFFASSVFGPVTYTPCPVLVFRRNPLDLNLDFVAHGTVLGADADRIVVKRIVLTGYPTRVHKRHAVVKYMFYNPEDVKWFKPAGLITKHGLEGNILESVGEHGTMKCLFNAPIKQHDTVCLPLYKRIFPKYAQCEEIDPTDGTVSRHDMLVL